MDAALVVTMVAATLAAALHVYVFVLESVLWTTPRVRTAFGVSSDDQAEHTKLLAFNQGFYNLFLALVTGAGVVLVAVGTPSSDRAAAGTALLVAGPGSMLAAALVLVLSDRGKLRAAAVQGLFPLVCLAALAASVA